MANWLQRAIYNLANTVPLVGMTVLARWLEFKSWRIPLILLAAAVAETVLFAACFHYGKKNCSVKCINVSKIISKDSWLVAYVIAYLFPLTYKGVLDYHIVSLIVVALMLVLFFLQTNMALPNILLSFVGYHFYEIETDSTGVGDYMLISKRRRIRNRIDVKSVMRVFDKLLIDKKGEK